MMENRNIVKFQSMREIKGNSHIFQRKMHVTRDLVGRLSLEKELEGHTGCVNCLQWNEAGDLLISGSDDLNIMLWTPFLDNQFHAIHSGHYGNIFSVKFIPGTNDHCIVSGAADHKIKVNNYNCGEIIFSCRCHCGRVKRLATTPNSPNMFWSAAEDGMILQFDLRAPHQCSHVCDNVLVNLVNHLGKSATIKCIAMNPVNTNLIAIGANDPYIRMYDRRMIKPVTATFTESTPPSSFDYDIHYGEPNPGEDNLTSGCVSYFVAGHLPMKINEYQRRYRSLIATYVTFSPDGKDLLANLGGEQIYLFNVVSRRKQLVFDINERLLDAVLEAKKSCDELKDDCYECTLEARNTNGMTNGVRHHSANCLHENKNSSRFPQQQNGVKNRTVKELPKRVNDIKICANKAFEKHNYSLAISLYNSAIVMCPDAACLYANRAAAYMQRIWDGDYYAAVRDCYSALDLDPEYLKAHFRLAKCLKRLNWTKEAFECVRAFRMKFPRFSKTKAFSVFEHEVKLAQIPHDDHEAETDTESEDEGSSASGVSNISLFPEFSYSRYSIPGIRESEQEKAWRASAYDYEYRYCGHCNTTTDIKEANFLGSYGEYIIAGSDDGSIFIWERATSNIVRVLRGDDSIVNCLQPHPSTCMLATSGIDPVVRLWSPRAEDGSKDNREVLNKDDAAFANQRRMNADPLEIMLLNMGYRLPGVLEQMTDELDSRSNSDRNVVQCRTS